MPSLRGRDLLSLSDLTAEELAQIAGLCGRPQGRQKPAPVPQQSVGVAVSQKPLPVPELAFSVAMYQLGGQVLDLNSNVTQIGRGRTHQRHGPSA